MRLQQTLHDGAGGVPQSRRIDAPESRSPHPIRSAAITVVQRAGKSPKGEDQKNAGDASAQSSGQILNAPREAAKAAAIARMRGSRHDASIAGKQIETIYTQADNLHRQTEALRVLNGGSLAEAQAGAQPHRKAPPVHRLKSARNRKEAINTAHREFRQVQREYRREFAVSQGREKAKNDARKEIRHGYKDVQKSAAKAIRKAKKATGKAKKTLISALGSGVMMFLLFGGLLLLVLCSGFGLFGSDSNTLRTVVTELQADYNNQVKQIQTDNPFDILHRSGQQADWREVLSVFAVDVAKDNEDGFPYSLDDDARDRLEEIFWDMNTIEFRVEEIAVDSVDDTDDAGADGESGTDGTEEAEDTITHLYITLSCGTADTMADELDFDAEQRDQLEEMLSPSNAGTWGSLLSGMTIYSTAVPNDGGWVYPLPEEAEIASPFGWRTHPIYGVELLHEGTDLSADSGTPVFAVRAGKVTAAGYNDSLGNYVDIDHQDGYQSRYLHMIFSIVHIGQEIEQGQIIGYVGSTGDSTGSHLHLALICEGSYIDPMRLITYVPPETEDEE